MADALPPIRPLLVTAASPTIYGVTPARAGGDSDGLISRSFAWLSLLSNGRRVVTSLNAGAKCTTDHHTKTIVNIHNYKLHISVDILSM